MSARRPLAIALLTAAAYVALPIATFGDLYAAGTEETPAANAEDADFVAGKKAVKSKNWDAAIASLNKVVARNAANADAHNLLGYSYRWKGMMEPSFKHYNEALKLEPKHKGAHEYIGVAYLKTNQPEKAKEHLAKLEQICGKGCEEYQDLAKAVAAYTPAK